MLAVLFVHIVFIVTLGNPVVLVLYFKPLCQTLSDALVTSLRTTWHWIFCDKACAIISSVIAIAMFVLLDFLNPCFESGRILFATRKFFC